MPYRIYGLDLDSPLALPGFPSGTGTRPWTLSTPSSLPPPSGDLVLRSAEDPDDAVDVFRPSSTSLRLAFSDGTGALLDAAARAIALSWPKSLSFDDALTYLVGPVLGAALRLEGTSVLHASAVDVDGGAVLVFGPAGAGKSTTTAALVERGFPLVTEDVSALAVDDAGTFVFRGGSRVKLWEDSVEGIRGAPDALPLLVPSSRDWHKRFLDARLTPHDRVPLRAAFLLDRRDDVEIARVEPLSAQERLLALVGNAYAGGVLDAAGKAREMARFSALASSVPLRRLVYPERFSLLPATVDALLHAVRSGRVAVR